MLARSLSLLKLENTAFLFHQSFPKSYFTLLSSKLSYEHLIINPRVKRESRYLSIWISLFQKILKLFIAKEIHQVTSDVFYTTGLFLAKVTFAITNMTDNKTDAR